MQRAVTDITDLTVRQSLLKATNVAIYVYYVRRPDIPALLAIYTHVLNILTSDLYDFTIAAKNK